MQSIDISIVIVSYNVRYFLEQCLRSILQHSSNLIVEIIVVDNISTDDTMEVVPKLFPDIIFIRNNENVGFARACNQGMKSSKGNYVLFLNPDTIIEEGTLSTCLQYMNAHDDVGAVGVRMIDGAGNFLEESKRGEPSLFRSFWKLSGISRIFPNSASFNGYNLGHIGEFEEAEVEVLCGAFMFCRRDVLAQTLGFDEDFFMFGEDIDLSKRIRDGGKKLVYLPSTTIVHYKGQSTGKQGFSYVRKFYNAMLIYTSKHYRSHILGTKWILYIAIVLGAFLSYMKRFLTKALAPVAFTALVYFGLSIISKLWATYFFKDPNYYQYSKLAYNILGYSLIWTLAYFCTTMPSSSKGFFFSIRRSIFGGVIILLIYALLPSELRASRTIILLGMMYVTILGIILNLLEAKFLKPKEKHIGIVAADKEYGRIFNILTTNGIAHQNVKQVDPKHFSQFGIELARSNQFTELIYALKDISISEVMRQLPQLGNMVSNKVIEEGSSSIIGSRGQNIPGEIYGVPLQFNIDNGFLRILRRLTHILLSLLFLLLCPLVFIFAYKWVIKWTKICWSVLVGKKDLIGYNLQDAQLNELPRLREGILSLGITQKVEYEGISANQELIHQQNLTYALNYSVELDLKILFLHMFPSY